MEFKTVRNINHLRKYFKLSNTSLTMTKIGDFEIIYSYYTPIGYIYNDELFILCDRTFSSTTARYLYTLKKIANYLISTNQLTIICRQLKIGLGWL